ncbi:DUF3159 domain-containing protein [Tsukamurella sp. 1534]|uniref:DUF3159 domain-containing protein n=1 Tax=Tsukamurella sp. 1534 TaxID=1151061 RepID=UPI0002DCA109|nr:DUF3159 domain-containing protein [Tsukamurella sp. 1534]
MTEGAQNDTAEDAAPDKPLKEQVLDQMGGWQGFVYSTLPVVVFVPVNALWGLGWGAGAALAAALLILVVRLATRTSVQPAISGFIGVAFCVIIALVLGGRYYYLYGIVSQAVLAVAFAVSIAVRRPLVGVLWHFFQGAEEGPDWRTRPRDMRTFIWLTVLWTVAFLVRFVIQGALFLQDSVNWLGVARIVMGWPMFAVLLLATFAVCRRLDTSGHDEPPHADDPGRPGGAAA